MGQIGEGGEGSSRGSRFLRESSDLVYENRYQQISRVAGDFAGQWKEYFVTDYGRRAGLVVVDGASVLMVRQYRLLIDRVSLEIPGGRIDSNEIPEAAAVRECLEETGLRCRNLTPLLSFHPGLDTLHNPTYLFHTGEFLSEDDARFPTKEVQGHTWVPLERCTEMIFGQQIVDSLSIIAILSYQTMNGGK